MLTLETSDPVPPGRIRVFPGEVYNNLTVIGGCVYYRPDRKQAAYCRCSCGKEVWADTVALRHGNVKSCGCLKVRTRTRLTHGESHTRLHHTWRAMTKRCRNKKDPYYGGKGITVCDAWLDYLTFKEWSMQAGYNDDLSIDRIDPDLNYCPENCQWITRSENVSKRLTDPYRKIESLRLEITSLKARVRSLELLAQANRRNCRA